MVDKGVLAAKTAAILDAVRRIREIVPATADALRDDRSAREIVILNLFVAIQESIALATHSLADGGWVVPETYGDVFLALADHGVIGRDVAKRLVSASGLRNLIAHQYGAIDVNRLHAIASTSLDDLVQFCAELTRQVPGESS